MNELSENEKWELAVFFKRLSFNLVLETTDGGADKAQAYRILTAIDKLQKELADIGYNPR
ncbi:MAG: hypothetical protein FWC06_08310 [Treponema sp.]|nr:hypothetical protein [Treponema sp.]